MAELEHVGMSCAANCASSLATLVAHRDLASRIHVGNAPKVDKPEPTRMMQSRTLHVPQCSECLEWPKFILATANGRERLPRVYLSTDTSQMPLPRQVLSRHMCPTETLQW